MRHAINHKWHVRPVVNKSVYQASPLKRHRRTKAQSEQLNDQIVRAALKDFPESQTSVRHVFYEMTDPRLPEPVEKTENGYTQVQERSVRLRRSGRIPYGCFADMSRSGFFTKTFNNASDFLAQTKGLYRGNLWKDADCRCEVWVESRSIAGVLRLDCHELAVDLYPCGGFSGISFAYEAAEEHNSNTDDSRPLHVFYIGDYDPAGVLIDVALERELRRHLRPDIELSFERIGINPAQIKKYNLPTKPRNKKDKRSPHIETTVEAEAMPAKILRGILRPKVEALLPRNALRVTQVAEESERQLLDGVERALRRKQS